MAEKKYVIAIDSGTQSVRAVIFDRQGNQVAIEQAEHEPYFSLQPGWAEQNSQDYWDKLCFCTKGVMAKAKIPADEITGLGITTQRSASFPVDREGNPLRPAIIWLDQRVTENAPPISAKARLIFSAMGLGDAMDKAHRESKFLWIQQHEPEIYKNTYKFLQISGWLVKKITGEFKDSLGMMVGAWPMDYKALKWHALDLAYETLAVKREHCVDLFPPDTVLGHVTKKAAEETGLPEGLPVVVGAGDKQSELLGAGAIDPSIAVISYGTATCMEVISYKYISEKHMKFYTWPSALPNAWNLEMFIFRGFWMVTWFKQEFGHREALEAEKRGVEPEVVLDEVISKIPPGSLGLMLQPYWTPMIYDKYAKGCIIGFGEVHTRAHIYRAILEGIGYELKRMYEETRRKTGIPVKEIRVGGGGSKSDVAVQIAADLFNLPVSRMGTSEICALGAAIDAAVGTGMFGSFKEAVDSMVKKGKTFQPDPASHRVYQALYEDVYLKTHKSLEPQYRRIAEITGYPVIYKPSK
ncbi:MAG: FGGY-family carbohydrate kinase [Dehalococcoidia bacterium]|jgi:sugar (pentulose or hexulose) kinase